MIDTFGCGHTEERRSGITMGVRVDGPCPACHRRSAQKAAQLMAWVPAQPDTRTPAQKQWAEDFAREMVSRLERQERALFKPFSLDKQTT